jgi:hypothetical protein
VAGGTALPALAFGLGDHLLEPMLHPPEQSRDEPEHAAPRRLGFRFVRFIRHLAVEFVAIPTDGYQEDVHHRRLR